MQDLVESSRIEACIEIIRTDDPFKSVMREKSASAAALFLGFLLREDDAENRRNFERLSEFLAGMPPAFIVCGTGGADFRA